MPQTISPRSAFATKTSASKEKVSPFLSSKRAPTYSLRTIKHEIQALLEEQGVVKIEADKLDEVDWLGYLFETLFIQYCDVKEQVMYRYITLEDVDNNDSGNILLYAYCHEVRAMRTFRTDRIEYAYRMRDACN